MGAEPKVLWFLMSVSTLHLTGTSDRERSVNTAPGEAPQHHHAGRGDGDGDGALPGDGAGQSKREGRFRWRPISNWLATSQESILRPLHFRCWYTSVWCVALPSSALS